MPQAPGARSRFPKNVVRTVLRHPSLWLEGIRTAFALSEGALPIPHAPYVQWRALTAYGRLDRAFSEEDLVGYLRWRRRMRQV